MNTTRRRFLQAAVLAGTSTAIARRSWADDLSPGTYPFNLDRSRDGVLYIPKGYRPAEPMPLVVMFHGAGGSGQSCQYTFPIADESGYIVLAPDSRDERTWDIILGEAGPDVDFLQAAFQQTVGRCAVDRRRLVVGGHSDGASYALSLGIGIGDQFGRLMAFSPGVMSPVVVRGKPKIFMSHGVSDNVMPIDDTSRKFVPRLKALGYAVTYLEYEGRHAVPAEIVREGFAWLSR